MRILVMGDFGGFAESPVPFDQRPIERIDIDNFEQVLRRIHPEVRLEHADRGSEGLELRFESIEDFHPDQLCENVPTLKRILDLRDRLRQPSTFEQAALELLGLANAAPQESDLQQATGREHADKTISDDSDIQPDDSALLDQILGGSVSSDSSVASSQGTGQVDRLIQSVIAPYIEPKSDPRQAECLDSVEAALSSELRRILADENFRSLESAWRTLHFLVFKIAKTVDLHVFVMDVSKPELHAAGDSSEDDLRNTPLFRRLVEQREQESFSLYTCLFDVTKRVDDLVLMANLGAIGAASGGPVLAEASPSFFSMGTWTEEFPSSGLSLDRSDVDDANWDSLRDSSVAPWIGLAAPRFLLRLPYGSQTDRIDAFDFEEFDDESPSHDELLWGAPAALVATLIGLSYLDQGPSMRLGMHSVIDGLPALMRKIDGDTMLMPCAEVFMPERVADNLLESGLIPLLSSKSSNSVQVRRFQSISSTACNLHGFWN